MNRGSAITGIGCYAPEVVVTNADLEKVFDTSDRWITERTGIKERRVMSWGPAPHSPVDSTATMAAATVEGERPVALATDSDRTGSRMASNTVRSFNCFRSGGVAIAVNVTYGSTESSPVDSAARRGIGCRG